MPRMPPRLPIIALLSHQKQRKRTLSTSGELIGYSYTSLYAAVTPHSPLREEVKFDPLPSVLNAIVIQITVEVLTQDK